MQSLAEIKTDVIFYKTVQRDRSLSQARDEKNHIILDLTSRLVEGRHI